MDEVSTGAFGEEPKSAEFCFVPLGTNDLWPRAEGSHFGQAETHR